MLLKAAFGLTEHASFYILWKCILELVTPHLFKIFCCLIQVCIETPCFSGQQPVVLKKSVYVCEGSKGNSTHKSYGLS